MLKVIFAAMAVLISVYTFAQDKENEIVPDGYNIFYHPNGVKASEGYMRDGKPEGYWKTYNESGVLVAEGNRVDHQLDSTWTFYNEEGKAVLMINYDKGLKEGIRRTVREDEIMDETFSADIKHGPTTVYYPEGQVKRLVIYNNGLEEGFAREFSPEGIVTTLIEYRRGFVVDRENINRVDKNGLKQGKWKYFFEDGRVKLEGIYRDDKRNGYFKEYDDKGMLVDIAKYVNDERQMEAPELAKLDVVTDYFPDGKVKTVASYKDNVPEGIRRDYDTTGQVIAAYTYSRGKIISEGIIDDEGVKDGPWKEYYENEQLKAEGVYNLGNRVGQWKFYHPNGSLEQEGAYNSQGNPEGLWKWYFDDGTVLREESFRNGLSDGLYTEYDDTGKIVVQGEFIDGLEEGKWIYSYGEVREEGMFRAGKRNGEWKIFYDNGQPYFIGSYIDDNPNGRHVWFFPDGKKRDEGEYIMGMKTGDWIQYENDGTVFLVIAFQNGIEKRYDGIKIQPEYEE